MKERPILFSAEMVRAILEGRKTQTRRVLKKQPLEILPMNVPDKWAALVSRDPNCGMVIKCRYGVPGDLLYVRETWQKLGYNSFEDVLGTHNWIYKASANDWELAVMKQNCMKWKPSIHMPKIAARLWLRVKDVRVERVQDISEEDAFAEGAQTHTYDTGGSTPQGEWIEGETTHKQEFAELWDHINKKRGYGWDVNPWVWVVEFEKVEHE